MQSSAIMVVLPRGTGAADSTRDDDDIALTDCIAPKGKEAVMLLLGGAMTTTDMGDYKPVPRWRSDCCLI